MTILANEHEFVTVAIMPFLRERWHLIDRPEELSGQRDGRLTLDELHLAHNEAMREQRTSDAFILSEIILRYWPLCRSYSDGYWVGEETTLGISEEDVSIYEQKVNPSVGTRTAPRPRRWI